MRSYFKYIQLIVIAAAIVVAPACNKKLDVLPGQNITPDQILTEGDVEATVLGAYKSLQHYNSYGERLFLIPDLMASTSDLTFVGTFQPYVDIALLRQQENNSIAEGIWSKSYEIINTCNIVLDKMDLVKDAEKQVTLAAEAKFIRGMIYFNLSGLFGKSFSEGSAATDPAVPLALEPVFSSTDLSKGDLARATVTEIFQQVETDLKDAVAGLPDDNDTRANKFAAYAFLSRLYLAQAKYPQAVAMADSVIESGVYELTNDFTKEFGNSSNTAEDIFAIQQTNQSNAGTSNNGMTTFYGARPNGRGDLQVNPAQLDQYEDGDVRKDFVYEGGSISGRTGIYTTKWGTLYSTLPVVRLAEMYLTRAEGNLRAGTAVGADPLDDVNEIRSRAHATTLGAVTADDAVAERFRELAFEGDKFWTSKRLKLDMNNRPYNAPKLILPVPLRERQVNVKLDQNSGY